MSELSNSEILSPILETEEELFSGLFCECFHLLSEHSLGKCYALDFNGTILKACNCKNPKSASFTLSFLFEEEGSKNADQTSSEI